MCTMILKKMIFLTFTEVLHDDRLMVVATHLDETMDDEYTSDEEESNGDDDICHEENSFGDFLAQVDQIKSLVHSEIKEVTKSHSDHVLAKSMIVPVSSSNALLSRQARLDPKNHFEKLKKKLSLPCYPPRQSKSDACLLEEYSQITVFEQRLVHLNMYMCVYTILYYNNFCNFQYYQQYNIQICTCNSYSGIQCSKSHINTSLKPK